MKLIDLLVQELPKRGGWPDGVGSIVQDFDGEVKGVIYGATVQSYKGGIWRRSHGTVDKNYGFLPLAIDRALSIVTREQYEAALAAAQQPVWDGEGLPPVGTKCEFKCATGVWSEVEITAIARNGLCFVEPGKDGENYVAFSREFRPIRSERDEAINQIAELIGRGTFHVDATSVYDAIARGDILGIKLSD